MDEVKRRGRPKKEEGKSSAICIRMSEEELKNLEYVCRKTGTSRSEVIREAMKMKYNLEKYLDD